jgi:xanthine dehydrogenase accessory factor
VTDNDAVLAQARDWLAEGKGVALATVIGTWGSSPRPPGSLLAVNAEQEFVGSVSGGCIEGAVITEAVGAIADGEPRLLDFGISDEQAWEVGLSCGGEMKIFVEKVPAKQILEGLIGERPIALATRLESATHALVRPRSQSGDFTLGDDALAAARQALAENRATTVDDPGGSLFVTVFNRPLRMIVVGAVHIAQALAPMAANAGFEVTVVDPRRTFATDARFPAITLRHDWPDDALAELRPDARTAVVTLTHDPKLDDPALIAALASDAYYVGALGSRKTHTKRLERLRAADCGEETLKRIHSPVGLALGGRKATEIAVSILAQAVAACHGRDKNF